MDMDKETMHWILDVQEAAGGDEEYRQLHEQYRAANERLLALLKTLPEEQQAVILNFIGTSAALYHRIMEIAYQM